jgi:hypothetical protein
MGTPTYIPLANLTLSSSAASVTFSSISQAYRDLVIVASAGMTGGGGNEIIWARFNSDSGTNYNRVYMAGDGSSAFSGSNANIANGVYAIEAKGSVSGSNVTSSSTLSIFDYSVSDKHKSCLSRMDVASAITVAAASRWASTSAITSITLAHNSLSIASGSTFALYGIAA